ncbi:hypothetical protein C1H46_027777 [Malus baccata]|uniref:FAD-binding PCMH-type domain-containing protein n=1 Tax=Malus baccata TaxID=106549 RepID=A0A540LJJ8_MALBA|nr:hypothetical protein C1H46_027777 [Malus baccata]
MEISHIKLVPLLFFFLLNSVCSTTSNSISESFVQCFSSRIHSNSTSKIILTESSSDYTLVLQSSIQNLRFLNTSTPKPQAIVTPHQNSHVQAAVVCTKKVGIQIRTRSGGHDYEGLSYVSKSPFIIIDLFNLRSIDIDIKKERAWVESGATLGELYYAIAQKSKLYGFPAGICPTIGVGGHISGGGHGGGGSNFGVIVAWKLRLVPVPPIVTGYMESKTIEEGATKLVSKWQAIADRMPQQYFLRLVIQAANGTGTNGGKTIQVMFNFVAFETVEKLLPWMQENFPELNLDQSTFTEMSWIESALYVANLPINESQVLLQRTQQSRVFFKNKSDFVTEPISEAALEGLWKAMLELDSLQLMLTPYGGRMSEIYDWEIPFPHRKGNLFEIQYVDNWVDDKETEEHIRGVRSVYEYMTPYVSKSPRAAYLNYRDLDLGRNKDANTSYAEASAWGLKYFKNNFRRLVQIKTSVDPDNFFRDEQSIPVLQSAKK